MLNRERLFYIFVDLKKLSKIGKDCFIFLEIPKKLNKIRIEYFKYLAVTKVKLNLESLFGDLKTLSKIGKWFLVIPKVLENREKFYYIFGDAKKLNKIGKEYFKYLMTPKR